MQNSPYLSRPLRALAQAKRDTRNARLRELLRRAMNSKHPEDWQEYRQALEEV